MGANFRMGSTGPSAWLLTALAACAAACSVHAREFDAGDPRSPLQLIRTIPLPAVRGRIDHMAIDAAARRLFVAELANGSVDEVDLVGGTVVRRIPGLPEPQGVAWIAGTQQLAVACGDGSVRFFRGPDWREVARVSLGDDADNVRIDQRNGRLIVGYGSGGLAVINPAAHRVVGQIPLGGHPEAFALDGPTAFVNVPGRRSILIADLDKGRVTSSLPAGAHTGNFPMAIDAARKLVAVAFRLPASVSAFDISTGKTSLSLASCGDADDLFFAGAKLAVVCGAGVVDLVSLGDRPAVDRVSTAGGARTGLLSSDGKTLFVAAPDRGSGASVWELKFSP